ncbi:MAG: hypothetical protein LUE16_00300 [Lachnospiraceae bacterium]|nr:hypothetical protein [Lachnospiraceae bacterium]
MKGNYERPVVLANEELAEGVYAASGATDCWTMDVYSVQDWNGSHHIFEVKLIHSASVVHISSSVTCTVTFSYSLSDAYSEFASSLSGTTITVTRDLLANAYNSGDTVTFKIWASTGDEATTKALSVTGYTVTCQHSTNVQGGYD